MFLLCDCFQTVVKRSQLDNLFPPAQDCPALEAILSVLNLHVKMVCGNVKMLKPCLGHCSLKMFFGPTETKKRMLSRIPSRQHRTFCPYRNTQSSVLLLEHLLLICLYLCLSCFLRNSGYIGKRTFKNHYPLAFSVYTNFLTICYILIFSPKHVI